METLTKCYGIMVTKGDFLNAGCISELVSMLLSYAILAGGALLQVPQIMNIMKSKSVAGLSAFALYSQVFIPITFITYNLLQGNPVATWGENIFSLIQNVIIVVLYWQLAKPKVSSQHALLMSAGFVGLFAACMRLPSNVQYVLPLSCLPLLFTSRVPQIIANYQNQHTGPLSGFSFVLIVGGSAARVYTTILEVGLDYSMIASYALGGAFAAILGFQCVYYGPPTAKDAMPANGVERPRRETRKDK